MPSIVVMSKVFLKVLALAKLFQCLTRLGKKMVTLQTVHLELGSFEDRKSLPKQWAGLSDKELKEDINF